jgi:hypothetical protein
VRYLDVRIQWVNIRIIQNLVDRCEKHCLFKLNISDVLSVLIKKNSSTWMQGQEFDICSDCWCHTASILEVPEELEFS